MLAPMRTKGDPTWGPPSHLHDARAGFYTVTVSSWAVISGQW
jgi:hypothetical protein